MSNFLLSMFLNPYGYRTILIIIPAVSINLYYTPNSPVGRSYYYLVNEHTDSEGIRNLSLVLHLTRIPVVLTGT